MILAVLASMFFLVLIITKSETPRQNNTIFYSKLSLSKFIFSLSLLALNNPSVYKTNIPSQEVKLLNRPLFSENLKNVP